MSTVEASTEPHTIWPRPPVHGVPTEGVAVRALSWKLLFPDASRLSGLRIEAIATCPTTTWSPLEYPARIPPPSAKPTRINWPAVFPSWELAEEAEGWPNCVIRPVPPAYGSHAILMSVVASERLLMPIGMVVPAAGSVNFPLESKE